MNLLILLGFWHEGHSTVLAAAPIIDHSSPLGGDTGVHLLLSGSYIAPRLVNASGRCCIRRLR